MGRFGLDDGVITRMNSQALARRMTWPNDSAEQANCRVALAGAGLKTRGRRAASLAGSIPVRLRHQR